MNYNKLTAKTVASLSRPGRYGDGQGLWLQVGEQGTKSWLFRYVSFDGRQRQMGLGGVGTVMLKDAREKARLARLAVLDGFDPIEQRREKRTRARMEAAARLTYRQCAERYIAANEAEWRNEKHRAQWRQTALGDDCKPILDLPVNAINTALVIKVLEPIWNEKRETASRLRGRIERVLAWATVSGFRQGDNPARWSGHLKEVFGSATRPVEHHAALPYGELAKFMSELRACDSVAARALEFLILTAARTGETIGATWDEIDLGDKVWTIPPERMKAGKEHRVPLPARAVAILQELPRMDDNRHVFVGGKAGAPLDRLAMARLLADMRPGYTPHGFRSCFRDWCADCTNFAKEIPEAALAHRVPDAVVAAYRRTTFFDKRRQLMEQWSRYCASKPVAMVADNVTALRARTTV